MADRRAIFIKLTIEDVEKAKESLRQVGADGERSLKRLESAAAQASKRLADTGAAAGPATKGFRDFATAAQHLGRQAATGEVSVDGLKAAMLAMVGTMGGPLGSIALVGGLALAVAFASGEFKGFSRDSRELAEAQEAIAKTLEKVRGVLGQIAVDVDRARDNARAETQNRVEQLDVQIAKLEAVQREQEKLNALFAPDILGNPENTGVYKATLKVTEALRLARGEALGLLGQYDDALIRIATGKLTINPNTPPTPINTSAISEHKRILEDIERLEEEAARKLTASKAEEAGIRLEQELEKYRKLLDEKKIADDEYGRGATAAAQRHQGEIEAIARDTAVKAAAEMVKASEQAAKEALKPWQKFGDDLASMLGDALSNGFKFDRAGIESAAFRLAGGMANQQFFNPLLSGLGLATALAGSKNSPLYNLGSSFSGGASVFGLPLFPSGAMELGRKGAGSATPIVTQQASLLQSGLGAAAQGFGVGSILSGLFPGTFGAQGSQIGGTLGGLGGGVLAAIPSVAGFLGPFAGLLGPAVGLLGSIFGGLFGNNKPSVGPNANSLLSSANGLAYNAGVGSDNGGNAGAARQFGDALVVAINRMVETLGFAGARVGGTTAAVTPSGFSIGFMGGGLAGGTDAEAVIRGGLFALLKRGDFFFDGIGEATAKAIANSVASDLEGLLADIEFARTIGDIVDGIDATGNALKQVEVAARDAARAQVKAIADFADKARQLGFVAEADSALPKLVDQLLDFSAKPEEITETAKALAALGANFKVLRESAEALGLTEARIAAAEAAATEELRRGFDAGIAQQILALVDPVVAALADYEKAAARRLDEAREAGADLVAVERLNGIERQKVLEAASGASQSSLRKFYDELAFGGLSGAAPLASIEGTRASFMAAAAQGDTGRIEELGRSLVTLSRGAYASSAGFQSDLDLVRNVVGPLVDMGNNAVVAAINAAGGEQVRYLAQIVSGQAALRAVTEDQAREIALLNSRLQRLLANG